MRLQFSIGLTSNPRTWPVIAGQIAPDAIDLVPTVLHPSELFWRQLRFAEFDVAEMSVSSLMMAKSKGDDRFVGIPVFTTRRFFHTGILVRRAAGIAAPAISRASASACRNISRPRRCGRAACCSTSSAWRRRTWSSGWSARRRTATAAPPASCRLRA